MHTEKDQISSKHIILLLMFVVFGCIANWIIVPYFYGRPTNPADFGDMFGAINALFSGLAFVGVIVAILLQKNELKLQREELENTRAELEGQKLQLEAQNNTMSKQSFESTFFNLIDLYNNIVHNITFDVQFHTLGFNKHERDSATSHGRDSFKSMYKYYKNTVLSDIQHNYNISDGLNVTACASITFDEIYNVLEPCLGHYYRTIQNILVYISESEVNTKMFYANILKTQLSSHELLLLHYYCLADKCPNDFRELIITFELVTHVPKYELIESAHARKVARTRTI